MPMPLARVQATLIREREPPSVRERKSSVKPICIQLEDPDGQCHSAVPHVTGLRHLH